MNIFVSCPGTEDAYAEAPDGAPLDDLDDLGSEELSLIHISEPTRPY